MTVDVIPPCRCGRPADYFTINPATGRLHAYRERTRQGDVAVPLSWCRHHRIAGPPGRVHRIEAKPPERPPARPELPA